MVRGVVLESKEKQVAGEESTAKSGGNSNGFSTRLREAMDGRSIREFASSAQMSAGTLHNYLNDESLPTLDKLISLVNTANVSLNWLATGRGPVSFDDNSTELSSGVGGDQLSIAVLKEAIECIEQAISELGVSMSPEKKSSVTASLYDLFREQRDQPVNREKVFRLIETALA